MSNDLYEDIESYVRSQRKNAKACFWTLHLSNSPDLSDRCKINPNWKNFHTEELEASLEELKNAVQVLSRSNHKYLILTLRTSDSDKHFTIYPFVNPQYQQHQQNAGIFGVGNQGAMVGNQLLVMQQQMFEMKMKYEDEIREMRHERDIDDLRAEIAAIKGTKKTGVMDKIMGALVGALSKPQVINKVISSITGTPVTDDAKAPETDDGDDEEEEQEGEEEYTEGLTEEQQKLQKDLHTSLNRLQKVFPDTGGFMLNFSKWVQKHPEEAKSYFAMMQTQNNEC